MLKKNVFVILLLRFTEGKRFMEDFSVEQSQEEKKKQKQKSLALAGIIIGMTGLVLFVSCFVWFVVKASQIESTRAQKILPVILFMVGLAFCIVGVVLSSLSKDKQKQVIDKNDPAFQEKLREERRREKKRKPRLGEISLGKLGDIYGNKDEDRQVEESIIENKIEEVQEEITKLEDKIESGEISSQMQTKGGLTVNLDEDALTALPKNATVLSSPKVEPFEVDKPEITQVEIEKPDMGQVIVERQEVESKADEIEKKIRGEK